MKCDLKFIHCSDLHLGSPFRKMAVSDPAFGERMMSSTFYALDRIIEKASEEKADFIIFSGDIFDRENISPNVMYRFAESLKNAEIKCYIAYGNHDLRREWEKSIPLSDNVIEFPSDHPLRISFPDEENKIADIIGISHGFKDEKRDLTEEIHGTDYFSIAVVHCDVDSASEGERYAPCRLNDLLSKSGIDYWALGHVHNRKILNEYPHVVYPGNTQGRNPRETGEKGAYLVTVRDGKVTNTEFFVTSSLTWEEVSIDITNKDLISFTDELSKKVKKHSLVKLRITGSGDLNRMIHLNRKGFIASAERTGCKIVDMETRTMPFTDIEERRNTGDIISAVIDESDILKKMSRNDMISAICSTKTSQNPEIKGMFTEMSDDQIRAMIDEALASLLERLSEDRS